MAEYSEVQFIAFNIRPGYKTGKSHKEYLGDEDHDNDIKYRCDLIKKAIEAAFKSKNVVKAPVKKGSASNIMGKKLALKVFMAPEFYFRGAYGGYPIEYVEKIMPKMKEKTKDDKYKHWLFIYGTAIGYKQHDEETKAGDDVTDMDIISAVDATTITLGPLTKSDDWKDAKVIERKKVPLKKGFDYEPTGNSAKVIKDDPKEIEIEIEKVEFKDSTNIKEEGSAIITLKKEVDCKITEKVDFGSDTPKNVQFRVTKAEKQDSKTVITVGTPHPDKRFDNCPDCKGTCKKFNEKDKGKCNCEHTHKLKFKGFIQAGNKAKINRRVLTLGKGHKFTAGKLATLSKPAGKTEVFNIAMVQKGGPAPAPSSGEESGIDPNREVIIYKEYVSKIDYVKTNQDWKQRKIYIHGQDDILVLATEGSADKFSKSYNKPGEKREFTDIEGKKHEYKISELSKSGLGGGSVFTIDGITFGLEVCLDHLKKRLDKCYKNEMSGQEKPHIHLIPSWGMSIGRGPICCRDKGLVFNVDGARSSKSPDTASIARVNDGTYWCDNHLKKKGNNGDFCKDCRRKLDAIKYCKKCKKTHSKAKVGGDCPECGKLQPLGKPIKGKDIKKTITNKDINKYFENHGKIRIYKPEKIPTS